ncbi:MAG: arginine--tRNA ligase [Acidaminococcaceae bacterium]|nr:arginine--tRNA ligase [Acidaminococcaceae bacterium]MBP3812100.1 arginine--tRNA ligase [Acidaminococcaceae bacterium]MBR1493475.1 arginine--tRNA ligase [Acidaminococcaceae bacterium]HAT98236.1 arginine--tRNA ligase [Acidaminococcaceae bacterium]
MDIKAILSDAIVKTAQAAIAAGVVKEGVLPEVLLTVPPKKEFGDFATNFAMQSARALRCNPRVLAQYIVEHLDCAYVNKMEIAGPGFINFYLDPDWMYDMLAHIVEAGENYGNLPKASDEKIQVEYVSANPTGPLHVGHGRGAAVGSALSNLLKAAGYDVEQEYYINDAGNQMNNLARSVNARYLELLGKPCEFPEDGYHGHDIIDTAQRIISKYGDRFLQMDEAQRLEEFKTIAYQEKLAALREDLERFNVHFDVWFSEKTLHEANKINEACDYLLEKGYMEKRDGALWLKSTEFGDDKDRVVIRDNGVPTYFAADIAYHTNKFNRGFDRVINLWGADHHGYIARMKAAMQCMGFKPEQLEILVLQMVRLLRDGQEVKMSKRTGQSVTLNELIDEVGTDAARFFFVMRSIDSQLDFDLDLAVKKSNDNPVFYVQYAHARICSIMRQVAEAGITVQGKGNYKLLTEPVEVDLIKKLGEYPEMLAEAAKERAVQQVAHYVYELAGLFHSAYNQCRILGVNEELQQARLAMVMAVGHVVRHALSILGVSAPEKM